MQGNRFYVINGRKYAFDLEKIKKFCLVSDSQRNTENEVIENYVMDEDGPVLDNKTVRDVKSSGNPQNDTIIYDLLKLFIATLLNQEVPMFLEGVDRPDSNIALDFASSLAMNTMREMGFIYEITE